MENTLPGKWVVHVGYQKSASTWLQLMVFPHLADAVYLGKKHPRSEPWVLKLRGSLLNDDCLEFSAEALRSSINAELAGASPDQLRIFSDEAIVGNWRQGSHDSKRNADRVRAVFGEAKILMVIRQQPRILESIYKTFLSWGGLLKFETFLAGKPSAQTTFSLDHVDYARLAEYYISLFGEDRVRVIPLELLAEKPQEFADEICRFLEVSPIPLNENRKKPANVGYSPNFCRYKRLANFVCQSKFNPDSLFPNYKTLTGPLAKRLHPEAVAQLIASIEERLGRKRQLMSDALKAKVSDYFSDSNRRLQRYVAHDLARYGYPM